MSELDPRKVCEAALDHAGDALDDLCAIYPRYHLDIPPATAANLRLAIEGLISARFQLNQAIARGAQQ